MADPYSAAGRHARSFTWIRLGPLQAELNIAQALVHGSLGW